MFHGDAALGKAGHQIRDRHLDPALAGKRADGAGGGRVGFALGRVQHHQHLPRGQVRAGHPWVFDGSIRSVRVTGTVNGDTVTATSVLLIGGEVA